VLKSSETWLHAWCPLFSVGFGMERLGKHLRDAPRKPLCEHWGFSFFFLFLILHWVKPFSSSCPHSHPNFVWHINDNNHVPFYGWTLPVWQMVFSRLWILTEFTH
jgi:hypothetical protein